MDLSHAVWRKSTRSQANGNCVEVATWHKSSRSQSNGNCVEVATWHKSSRSQETNCVEVADDLGGVVGMRDSKDTSGPILVFSPGQWTAFIDGVKSGEFDLR